MPGVQVLSYEEATHVLTPKRRQIIETLKQNNVASVSELARSLNRDKGQVSRDLKTLAEHGIIRYDESDRAKAPYLTQRHIVVEPIV
ncbi:helix-turn-helix domain-containing protein [Salarchaeum sp. JOR-1]|nr:helix-turn-helix domain-containing protein [Salarchaeum sp. JOR-1]